MNGQTGIPIWYGKRASVVQNHPELQNGTAKPGFPVRNGLAVASRTAEVRFLRGTTADVAPCTGVHL